MKYEYLILNLLILIGPLSLSFDQKVHFYKDWPYVLKAIAISMALFLIWDVLVTDQHWTFHPECTLALPVINLPLGEILFFITVPYACLFTWQVLIRRISNSEVILSNKIYLVSLLFILLGFLSFYHGKYYTFLTSLTISGILFLDYLLKTAILKKSVSPIFFGLLILFIFLFNGYLTARPIVMYNASVQLNFRIYTIPVEDFFYGISHVFLNIILFTWFQKRTQ